MVMMPPRHGKSQFISQYFPPWYLGLFPDRRVILCSYEADFASSWGRKARDLLEEHGAGLFGVRVRDDSSAADRWEISGHVGGMWTAGVGGPITGKGADVLIIDDPVKNDEEARSAVMREKTWEWYRNVARTRLEPDGAIILIMTRWHKDDLAGRLLEEMRRGGEQWDVLKLPAFALPNDPLGRVEGEPLWPERYDREALLKLRTSCDFQSLYQQDPVEEGGDIFRREWWRYYPVAPEVSRKVHSWDTSFKKGQGNDYSVCTVWGEGEKGYYLLDVFRSKVEFPELKRIAVSLYERDRPQAVLVEDAASGQSLLQELARDTLLPLVAVKVDSDKRARAYAVTALIESGRVLFPESAPWLYDVIEELSSFPKGPHDDVVDSLTQAIAYLQRTQPSGPGPSEEDAVFGGSIPEIYGGGLPKF